MKRSLVAICLLLLLCISTVSIAERSENECGAGTPGCSAAPQTAAPYSGNITFSSTCTQHSNCIFYEVYYGVGVRCPKCWQIYWYTLTFVRSGHQPYMIPSI